MVIFHSYVSLPEGILLRRHHVAPFRLNHDVRLEEPLLIHLADPGRELLGNRGVEAMSFEGKTWENHRKTI